MTLLGWGSFKQSERTESWSSSTIQGAFNEAGTQAQKGEKGSSFWGKTHTPLFAYNRIFVCFLDYFICIASLLSIHSIRTRNRGHVFIPSIFRAPIPSASRASNGALTAPDIMAQPGINLWYEISKMGDLKNSPFIQCIWATFTPCANWR